MSEIWQEVQYVVHEALQRSGGARAQFLKEACAGNPTLRQEVESLLAMSEEATDFIEEPLVSLHSA